MSAGPAEFRHSGFKGWIGIARRDMTPPVGIYSRCWGAAKHDVAESIHRPLTLTAMVLQTGDRGHEQILIEGDLGWWKSPAVFQRFRAELLRELDLEETNLIFALSHTHAGPPLMEPEANMPGGELVREWLKKVLRASIEATREAREAAVEATLDWNYGTCNLATTRDLPDPATSSIRYLCGYNPAGQADNTLLVGRITDLSGKVIGTIVNYACHPTTLAWENNAISPDYPGAMRVTIEQETGAPALFLQGISGELSPRYQYTGDTSVADRHGRALGFAALSTLASMEPVGTSLKYQGVMESGAPLAVWKHEHEEVSGDLRAITQELNLPLKDWPSAAELEVQRQKCTDRTLEERLLRRRNVRLAIGDGESYSLPIHVWKLGDAVLVGTSCEGYSMMQQELRRRFAGTAIICMNLINGTVGYLPPARLYDTDLYQVWQTPFARGCLEATLEKAAQLIHDILCES